MNKKSQNQALDGGPKPNRSPNLLKRLLILANLSLLVLFPVAWNAPILKAGLLPFFSLEEITVLTGLQELWAKDIFLAVIVTFFALVAPYFKTVGLALIHFDLLSKRLLPAMAMLGKLAMADIFLLSIYIIAAKGIGVGRVETAWGLYMFTGCVLASFTITFLSKKS